MRFPNIDMSVICWMDIWVETHIFIQWHKGYTKILLHIARAVLKVFLDHFSFNKNSKIQSVSPTFSTFPFLTFPSLLIFSTRSFPTLPNISNHIKREKPYYYYYHYYYYYYYSLNIFAHFCFPFFVSFFLLFCSNLFWFSRFVFHDGVHGWSLLNQGSFPHSQSWNQKRKDINSCRISLSPVFIFTQHPPTPLHR